MLGVRFCKRSWYDGAKFNTTSQSIPRADKNKDFDPEHWTLVVVEQGIGDQILFLSVMEEAIKEFKNIFLIVEARMKSIIERSFPNLQVGLPGLLESWQKMH